MKTTAPPPSAPASADDDGAACTLVENGAGPGDVPWPSELKPWVARVAQRLRGTGRPADLALSLLLGDVADGDRTTLAAQIRTVVAAAAMTTDPNVYLLAIEACGRLRDETEDACRQLNAEQLFRLDPENVQLWLVLAEAAHVHQDHAMELDALYHASVARNFETPMKAAARTLAAAIPGDAPAWVRFALIERLLRDLGFASEHGEMHDAVKLSAPCVDSPLEDVNRRELCDKLAQNLLERSSNPDTLMTGLMVAEQLHWPDGRLAPFRSDALLLQRAKLLMPNLREAACGGSAHGLALLEAIIAEQPMALLRSDRLRHGMDMTEQARAIVKPPVTEPNAMVDDESSAGTPESR